MANTKISQLTSKSANLAATDLVEISEVSGSGYVSKRVSGQEIIDGVLANASNGTVTSVTGGTGLNGGTITTSGTLSVKYGTTSGTAAEGNDSRLSDSRPPSGTAGGDLSGTYPNPTVPGLASKEPLITPGTTAQYYRGDKSFQTLDKTAVGLGNVDNTSDANKPISTATQTALNAKQDTLVSGTNIKTINTNSILGSGDLTISNDLVNDLTPQLGGNLDVNGKEIVSTANGNITIAPDGTGDVHLNTDSVRIGDNNADATIVTRGTGDLILRTHEGDASQGSIRIYDGANGNIELLPNGSGSVLVGGNSTQATELRFLEDSDNGTNYVGLKAADNLAASTTYTLPTADGISGQVLQTNGSGTLSWSTATGGVPTSRLISTTAPLSGGGDLSADRTLSISDAVANGTTKGAATFTASDFSDNGSGVISLDYANGQKASGSQDGFLSQGDYLTFSGKQNQLNGTGFVKASGTTITYDNSTYLTSAITSLNGLTASTQTFATPGTTGTAPNWNSATSAHTLNIPSANASGVTAGLISNTEFNTFNNKVSTGAITGSGLTMATSRLLGRTTASSGAVEEISIGTGLTLSGGTLSAAPNVQSVSSAATVTPTSSNDLVKITAQAVALTLAAPTGSPVEGQALMIRIKDDGTARGITWTSGAGGYRAIGVTLPTTTMISKTTYVGLIYNSTDNRWDAIGVTTEA